jgi:hypothetical protein
MKITRVYATHLWIMSFVGSFLFTTVMLTSLLIIIFSRTNDLTVVAALLTLVVVSFFSVGKSLLRMNAVDMVLKLYRPQLRRQRLSQLTLWSLAPALFFYNAFSAWASRRIEWRGTVYEMVSPTETRIVSAPSPKE